MTLPACRCAMNNNRLTSFNITCVAGPC